MEEVFTTEMTGVSYDRLRRALQRGQKRNPSVDDSAIGSFLAEAERLGISVDQSTVSEAKRQAMLGSTIRDLAFDTFKARSQMNLSDDEAIAYAVTHYVDRVLGGE